MLHNRHTLPGLHALIRTNPEVQGDESSSRQLRCCIMSTKADVKSSALTLGENPGVFWFELAVLAH